MTVSPQDGVESPADHPGPLVFVADLEAPELSDADRHHLERVLRVRPGDPLTVGDGAGRWRPAVFGPSLDPTGPIAAEAQRGPLLTIGFALVKGDKPELIVQKLTELGIDRIVPFHAERSVVRWDAGKVSKAGARLRAVARSASMQCHRAHLPVVEDLVELASLVAVPGTALADRDGAPPSLDHPILLVGPEGGWSPAERAVDLPRTALGTHTLRAETAAIVAGALMTALRAGRVAGIDRPTVT